MDIQLLIPAVALALAIAVALYLFVSQLEERQVVRDSLRQLDGYEVDNTRDQELLNPLKERALMPVLNGLTGLGRRFTPAGYVDGVRQKFIRSGNPSQDSLDGFLAVRAITVFLAVVSFFCIFVLKLLPLEGKLLYLVGGFIVLLFVVGPDAILNRRVEERQYKIRLALPDIMDLLVISVEAGLGFEQAIDRTVDAVPGPLSDEFIRMLGEVRAGASRADAMRALDERTDVDEVRSFVLAILQADKFGVSIGRVLRAQADEMRIRRRQAATERAQKAPVKMMIPMVFCIFPALFVVVIGPAFLNIASSGGL